MITAKHALAVLSTIVTCLGAALASDAPAKSPAPAARPHPKIIMLTKEPMATPPSTSYCVANFGVHCYQPFQMISAYNVGPLHADGIDGRGVTIVIVDSFGSPTIASDLQVFDQSFGIQDPPSFKIIQPAGPVPAFDPTDATMVGWAGETTLDVEWAHVYAPGASILLVETPVAETEGVTGFPEIVAAENYVIDHELGDVISQSFAATEETFPGPESIFALRSAYFNAAKHRVTVLAASGDEGATSQEANGTDLYPYRVNSWPSTDPLVTSVGGSQLTLDDTGARLAPDVVWNDGYGAGGGGVSAVFRRPQFQDPVGAVVGKYRGTPDISMSAACDGGVWTYSSYPPFGPGFNLICGTSEATPSFAGIVAMSIQLAGHRLGTLGQALYHLDANRIVDIYLGNNSFGPFTNSDGNTYTVIGYDAVPGYDLASGLGTLDANRFVRALALRHDDD